MTPTDFEKYKQQNINEERIPLTSEEFNVAMDMLGVQDVYLGEVEFQMDGFGITLEGKVVYTNNDDINYQKAIIKQRRKNRFKIVK